jgi:hypothetical protein
MGARCGHLESVCNNSASKLEKALITCALTPRRNLLDSVG